MVLTDQAETQDNETLPGAESAHHFGNVPWQPSAASATSRLGICPGEGRNFFQQPQAALFQVQQICLAKRAALLGTEECVTQAGWQNSPLKRGLWLGKRI